VQNEYSCSSKDVHLVVDYRRRRKRREVLEMLSLELIVVVGVLYAALVGVMLWTRLPAVREARAKRAAESDL
jgi:predicted nucleic acid-binding Zn ribbon protein